MQQRKVVVINPTNIDLSNDTVIKVAKRKVCAYARVSTDQDDQLNSYKTQINEYAERIKANEQWEFVGMYADEGISGTGLKKRVSFMNMIDDARAGKIDLILTKSLSRFSRNTVDSITIIRELRELNVEVFFEKENLYSSDPKVDFMLTIFSSIAQEEARNISENVKWGIRKRFKEGKVKINTKRFLGYDKDTEGNLVINETEAQTIKMIFNMYVAGKSYRDICNHLIENNLANGRGEVSWNPSSIKSILENEKYMGDLILQKRVVMDYLTHKSLKNDGLAPKYHVMNNHPGIVSKELFQLAKVMQENKANNKSSTFKEKYPLSGIVYCAACGRPMNRHYYNYNQHNQRIVLSCKNNYHNQMPCSARPIDNETLELACGDAIKSLNLLDNNIIKSTLEILSSSLDKDTTHDSINALQNQINETENEIIDLIQEKIKDTDTSKAKYYNEIYLSKKDLIETYKSQIKDLERNLIENHKNKERMKSIESFLENDETITSSTLSTVFNKVIVENKNQVYLLISDTSIGDISTQKIKDLTPIYTSSYQGSTLKRFINYSVIKIEGDVLE